VRAKIKEKHVIASLMEYPCPGKHLGAMAICTMAEHNPPMSIGSGEKPTGKTQAVPRGKLNILQDIL
jgi:hypothetical protein